MLTKKISPASACFPGLPLESSINSIFKKKPIDFIIKEWDYSHFQLCPQHVGYISEKSAENIVNKYPNTKFRLHANVRLFKNHQTFDSSENYKTNKDYILKLKLINKILGNPAYSYHCPMSGEHNWETVFNNVEELESILNTDVAIEGLYPGISNMWENQINAYEKILSSKAKYAVDLSHINIGFNNLTPYQQEHFKKVIIEMIENDRCLEIHISNNNGKNDQHKPIQEDIWWLNLLNQTQIKNTCIVFCESKQN